MQRITNFQLVTSTHFFLIPVYYAYISYSYYFMLVYIMMYIGSVLYHSTNDDTLHKFDIFTSRFGGLLTFIMYSMCNTNSCLPIILLHNTVTSYLLSRFTYNHTLCGGDNQNCLNWIYFHMYFHLISSITWSFIVYDCKLSYI